MATKTNPSMIFDVMKIILNRNEKLQINILNSRKRRRNQKLDTTRYPLKNIWSINSVNFSYDAFPVDTLYIYIGIYLKYSCQQVSQLIYRRMKGQPRNIQETKKRNNQIINNLKSTLSKPTIVEAQRTLKIMEKLIDRINLFMNLDSQFIMKFNEINNPQKLKLNKTLIQQLSPEILDLIVKEAKMQVELKGYVALEQQIKEEGEGVDEEKMNEYERVKKDTAYSFRSLLRGLQKADGNDLQILKSLKNSVPNNQIVNIHEALSNYKIIMQKTLATAAEEEESHTRLIEELQHKIESLQKTKNNCEKQLLKLREDRAKHAQDKKEEMDKLKSQIREVESNRARDMDQITKNSQEMSDSLAKEFKKEEDSLINMINQEKKQLTKFRTDHSTAENRLKLEKQNNESMHADNLQQYDVLMEERKKQKQEKDEELKKKSDELNNLKRHFLQIQEERKREQALLQAHKKRKQEWQLMQKRKGEASTKIKEAFRLWKAKNKKKKKKRK